MSQMIEVKHLSKRYALGETIVEALSDISFSMNRGEFISIMGSSGSGKSTLLHILGALDAPTEGEYLLEGHDIAFLRDREQARIRNRHFGFIFQAYNLFLELTALGNVEMPLIYSGTPPAERRERAKAALEQVGLSHRIRHHPTQLSGGEQQRVAIARALVTEPTLLLADEPTGNLSKEGGGVILDILQKLHAEGMSIIMVTHDPEVGSLAPRVLKLSDGKLISDIQREKVLV
ncbi:ABC transporter ATP-binding protein [Deinococcus cellulosilyticus]|uniref:ABC transporter ATP-binding protein n=1 Tax=Deinococcus cellulosilyticus (strain DSM 18568 / NBRC 106333 / KACC 11606 / 5516J-15) TaxID=1223518 RepID=A0A511MYR8_DEIC1|nr:ABC transporter ATP-binding protein [Deinococcus cellulosilyticus]GEM45287.1 ABC transporter ATP-binding protein [Deinococcus cellulosilyticus NBRC 106333 = KACC 11606]